MDVRGFARRGASHHRALVLVAHRALWLALGILAAGRGSAGFIGRTTES